ncbi:ATP-binding protein [Streptomyces sp. NPDC058257]|uniref:ATP-binding protein n=1 Tax=Streptomyces sp. NPDC058257 TaxID=3346409 RepID=UPI0036EA098A
MGDDGTAPDEPAAETAETAELAFELDGTGTCIARARHLAAGFLARMQTDHGLTVSRRATDLTQLVISELVTNSLKYAPGPVLVNLRITAGAVEVAVRDSGPVLPRARAADTGRVGQHGLEIVLAVAQRFEARKEPGGKSITVSIALRDNLSST